MIGVCNKAITVIASQVLIANHASPLGLLGLLLTLAGGMAYRYASIHPPRLPPPPSRSRSAPLSVHGRMRTCGCGVRTGGERAVRGRAAVDRQPGVLDIVSLAWPSRGVRREAPMRKQ